MSGILSAVLLAAVWATTDTIIPAFQAPASGADTLELTAWRGETVGARALIYSAEPYPVAEPLSLTASSPWVDARFVSYVLTDDQRSCGAHDFSLSPWEVADVIGLAGETATPEPGKVLPIWVRINVPADAAAGVYDLTVSTTGAEISLPLRLRVQDRSLPSPKEWAFHTDFWQQPYAVSRYEGVERWSAAHLTALKPYLLELARSGQKVATTILFYEPWGEQSHDKFDPMVRTSRLPDGRWTFDYEIFDRYVSLCEEVGIADQINCYSMIPWDMSFRYFDVASGSCLTLSTQTDTEEYRDLWRAFLTDFSSHLKETGRFERTCIAMDERGLNAMLDAEAIIRETVPEMKIALAGYYHPELVNRLYDYSLEFGKRFSSDELDARRRAGNVTTFYTCCSTPRPNLFSNNDPSDATWLPLYAAANGLDGYLHWSWINWPDEPLTDSRFRLFAAGDTYLFYPGPRSSVRYERYIEGVELAEKIRLLRASGADCSVLDRALAGLDPSQPTGPQVEQIRQIINNLPL